MFPNHHTRKFDGIRSGQTYQACLCSQIRLFIRVGNQVNFIKVNGMVSHQHKFYVTINVMGVNKWFGLGEIS